MKVVVLPTVTVELLQVIVPPLPAGGVVHDHAGSELWKETKVMSLGRVSLIVAAVASFGPELLTLIV